MKVVPPMVQSGGRLDVVLKLLDEGRPSHGPEWIYLFLHSCNEWFGSKCHLSENVSETQEASRAVTPKQQRGVT